MKRCDLLRLMTLLSLAFTFAAAYGYIDRSPEVKKENRKWYNIDELGILQNERPTSKSPSKSRLDFDVTSQTKRVKQTVPKSHSGQFEETNDFTLHNRKTLGSNTNAHMKKRKSYFPHNKIHKTRFHRIYKYLQKKIHGKKNSEVDKKHELCNTCEETVLTKEVEIKSQLKMIHSGRPQKEIQSLNVNDGQRVVSTGDKTSSTRMRNNTPVKKVKTFSKTKLLKNNPKEVEIKSRLKMIHSGQPQKDIQSLNVNDGQRVVSAGDKTSNTRMRNNTPVKKVKTFSKTKLLKNNPSDSFAPVAEKFVKIMDNNWHDLIPSILQNSSRNFNNAEIVANGTVAKSLKVVELLPNVLNKTEVHDGKDTNYGIYSDSEMWTEWGSWDECYGHCQNTTGRQKRQRFCVKLLNSSVSCKGDDHQFQKCPVTSCKAKESSLWLEWSQWSRCSRSCDSGFQTRSRNCSQYSCFGDGLEIQMCSIKICQSIDYTPMNNGVIPVIYVRGNWLLWSQWSSCPVSCGEGRQSRNRNCTVHQQTAHQKINCIGHSTEEKICILHACNIAEISAPEIIPEGKPNTFECKYPENASVSEIYWINPKKQRIDKTSEDNGYTIDGKYLTINHVEKYDQGTYHCVIIQRDNVLETSDSVLEVSSCSSQPCFHGGTCIEFGDTAKKPYFHFTCACLQGHYGIYCESVLPSATIIWSSGIAAFLVLCAIIMLVIYVRHRRSIKVVRDYATIENPIKESDPSKQKSWGVIEATTFSDTNIVPKEEIVKSAAGKPKSPDSNKIQKTTVQYTQVTKKKPDISSEQRNLPLIGEQTDVIGQQMDVGSSVATRKWSKDKLSRANSVVSLDDSLKEISSDEYISFHDQRAEEQTHRRVFDKNPFESHYESVDNEGNPFESYYESLDNYGYLRLS